MHIPSAHSLDIFHYKLEIFKVQCRDCVEADIKENQCPFEESIDSVGWYALARKPHFRYSDHTSRDLVDLVLDEEIYQRHKSAKEAACQHLAVLDSCWVARTERKAAQGPWQCSHKV